MVRAVRNSALPELDAAIRRALLVAVVLVLLPLAVNGLRKVSRFGLADLLLSAEPIASASTDSRTESRPADYGYRVLFVGESAAPTQLRAGDLIVLADGKPPRSLSDPAATLAHRAVELTVLRDGRATLLAAAASPSPWDVRYLFLFGIGVAFLFSAFAALWRSADSTWPRANLLFAALAVACALVLGLTPAPPFDGFYRVTVATEDVSRAFLPALLLAFTFTFPRRARGVRPLVFFLPAFLLLAVTVAVYSGALSRPTTPSDGLFYELVAKAGRLVHRLDVLQTAWLILGVLVSSIRLLALSRQRIDLITEKRIRYMLFGTAAGLLPICLLNLVPFAFGTSIPVLSTLSIVPIALVPVAFWASLSNYRLWDVEVFAREAVAVLSAGFLGAALFSGAQILAAHPVPAGVPYARGTVEAAAGLAIALGFRPVRRAFSASLARLQYGERLSEREALKGLVRDLTIPRRFTEIANLVAQRVESGLGVTPAALFAVTESGEALDAGSVDGGLPLPLAELPKEALASTTRLSRLTFTSHPTAAVARLRRAGFRTVSPLRVSGRLLGVFAVGDRLGRIPLSKDDLDVLETVLAPTALALEHARLYRELESQAVRYRTLKEFHEDVVSGSAAAIAATDALGRFTSVNPAFAAQAGRAAGELIGVAALRVLPPVLFSPQCLDAPRRLELDLGQGSRTFDVAVSPFPGAPVDSLARVYVLQDATETVRLEKALADRERLDALSTLSAGVAHEVNTPLTGVASFTRLLLDETAPEDPRRPLMEKIERQAFRASRLVGSLLDLARGRPRELSPLSPADLVREAVTALREEIGARSIQLVEEVAPSIPRIAGHADALVQVFINLLKNAIEASWSRRPESGPAEGRANGQVVFRVRHHAPNVIFDIEDDGPGLTKDQVSKIFEPFYSTKNAQGGVGLGLAIAGDIIRTHGGQVTVASEPGKGSRFSVALPAIA